MDNTNVVGADFPDEELNAAWRRYTRRLTFERDDARGAFDAGFVAGRFGKASTPPADDVRGALWNTVMNAIIGTHSAGSITDAILAEFEVCLRGTVTDAEGPYEYCVVNGLGHGIYMARTLEEAREGIAKEQRVGQGELRPKRSIVRRRRAGAWESFS